MEKLPSSYDLATPQPFWTLLYSIYYFVSSILILLDSTLKQYIRGMLNKYPRYSNNIFGRVDTTMDYEVGTCSQLFCDVFIKRVRLSHWSAQKIIRVSFYLVIQCPWVTETFFLTAGESFQKHLIN